MHTPVFMFNHQVLLSVLAQHGQVALCFYDSKDFSLHYMADTPDNHELHLLARGKQHTACYTIWVSFPEKIVFMVFMFFTPVQKWQLWI